MRFTKNLKTNLGKTYEKLATMTQVS